MSVPSPTEARYQVRTPEGRVVLSRPGRRSLVTWETVAEMERWAKAEQDHPAVRAWAVQACASVDDCRSPGEAAAKAIAALVRQRVRFVQGPYNVQLLHAPGVLASMPAPAGNCVDMTTLTEAMCLSIGLNPQTVRVAFTDDGSADPYEHVEAVVECRGLDGQPVVVVLDSTVPESEVEPTVRRAVRTYVHEPVGRPSVVPASGPLSKEAMVVQTGLQGCFGFPGCGAPPPPTSDGKADRCGCGSGRLAGPGGCSQCTCTRDGTGERRLYPGPWAGRLAAVPTYGEGVPGEIAADLAGGLGVPLSQILGRSIDAANDVIRACAGRTDAPEFAWIVPARSAAIAVRELVLMAEQSTQSFRSPEAKATLAARIWAILPARSLHEWCAAFLVALGEAAQTCARTAAGMQGCGPPGSLGWGVPNRPGRAGSMGAAGDLADRLVNALIPEGPFWEIARAAARAVVSRYDVASICQNLPEDLVAALAAIPGAGISREKIEQACGNLFGAAMTADRCAACRQDVTPVPPGMEALVGAGALAQPLQEGLSPFEGDWTMTNVSGRFAGGVMGFRLFDRGGYVLGGSAEGYGLLARKSAAGDVADGWFQASDRTLTCIRIAVTPDGIRGFRVSCRACPANCAIFNEVVFTRPGAAPPLGPAPGGEEGFPTWAKVGGLAAAAGLLYAAVRGRRARRARTAEAAAA